MRPASQPALAFVLTTVGVLLLGLAVPRRPSAPECWRRSPRPWPLFTVSANSTCSSARSLKAHPPFRTPGLPPKEIFLRRSVRRTPPIQINAVDHAFVGHGFSPDGQHAFYLHKATQEQLELYHVDLRGPAPAAPIRLSAEGEDVFSVFIVPPAP